VIHLFDDLIPDGTNAEQVIEEIHRRQWFALDHLLVQVWESRSIRPRATFTDKEGMRGMRDCIGGLLPEITKRGIIDLVDCTSTWYYPDGH
jgi:hypothetical protein